MAFTVQQQDGSAAQANSYAEVAFVRAYFTDRGVDLAAHNDAAIQAALVTATDFMDARYSFVGTPLKANQGTQCPRYLPDTWGGRRYLHDAHTLEPAYLLSQQQWETLKKACAQLARRALVQPVLMPDPAFDASGQKVKSKTVKAGPVETSVEYADAAPGLDATVPTFPAVDLMLRQAGLLVSRMGGTIGRA
jgi:hypothetical protein